MSQVDNMITPKTIHKFKVSIGNIKAETMTSIIDLNAAILFRMRINMDNVIEIIHYTHSLIYKDTASALRLRCAVPLRFFLLADESFNLSQAAYIQVLLYYPW